MFIYHEGHEAHEDKEKNLRELRGGKPESVYVNDIGFHLINDEMAKDQKNGYCTNPNWARCVKTGKEKKHHEVSGA